MPILRKSIVGTFLADKGAGANIYEIADFDAIDPAILDKEETRRVDIAGFVAWLERLAGEEEWVGLGAKRLPVVVTYDAAWTTAPAWPEICARWRVEVTAKSRGDIYLVHLFDGPGAKSPALVIWDLAPVDRHGVPALARFAGCAPGVLALPRFLYATEQATPEIDEEDFGGKVITQTGVARCIMQRRVGALSYTGKDRAGKPRLRTLAQDYARTAKAEEARNYREYATRRACNRGGLVFVAAREAGQVLGRTISVDEVSAHHAQALAHLVPERFREATPAELDAAAARVSETSRDDLLARYRWPWPCAFNGLFEFEGLRLRPGSVWERQEIGAEGHARFADHDAVLGVDAPTAEASEAAIRAAGYRDEQEGGEFAFGHLMGARRARVWLSDLEFWVFSRVYAWDRVTAVRGEITGRRRRPDDLAIMSSLTFFEEKQRVKAQLRSMPAGAERDRLEEHYVNCVKARFNALGYGLHAQDDYRPGFVISPDGEWTVGPAVTEETFAERRPKRPRSWYVYGSRISGWARVALVVAAELVFAAFGDEARIVAGDTDSLKIRTDLPAGDVLAALAPLHDATRGSIEIVTERARRLFPDEFHDAPRLGFFEEERDGEFAQFYAAWQKAYVGETTEGAIVLTLAGVPRGADGSLLAWLRTMTARHGFGIVRRVLCFGARLAAGLSHVEVATYGRGEFPVIRQVDYNLADCTTAEAISSIRWQRARNREVPVDASAYAGWQDGRPILVADGDTIWTA